MHDHELFAEPLCLELYQAFSGLFSIKDCQRALKLNNDDIEVSVQWMLEEKSKPDRENHLAVKKSQVIYESLVQVYN
jgi:accessory colonization factor AcfC